MEFVYFVLSVLSILFFWFLIIQIFPDEAKREKEFYRSKGLVCPKDILQNNDQIDVKKAPDEEVNDVDFHRYDEQVKKV